MRRPTERRWVPWLNGVRRTNSHSTSTRPRSWWWITGDRAESTHPSPSTRHLWSRLTALSSSAFTSPRISHGLLTHLHYIYIYAFSRRFYPKRLTIAFRLYIFISMSVPCESNPQLFALLTQCSTTEPHRNTQMQCWRRHISVSSSWDGWGSLERALETSDPSTPALWRASWPAASPPGLETAPLATANLCKGSCELPATLLEVSFPPSRISTPGGVQGMPGGLSKTPATRPTDCSLCCPQGDVSAASDPALADWGTAFSLRLSG